MTVELNNLLKLQGDDVNNYELLQRLTHQYFDLEATLLQAKTLRQNSNKQIYYLTQDAIEDQSPSYAYLFTPFIFANLNKQIYYHTPASDITVQFLKKHYQVDQVTDKINSQNILNAMSMHIVLDWESPTANLFVIYQIFSALCQPEVKTIFILSNQKLNHSILIEIEIFFKVKIIMIPMIFNYTLPKISQIDFRQIFFKKKDILYKEICLNFAESNSQLLTKCDLYTKQQAINLIEDMFYSEHIFEKLSVYSEYVQTIIQNKKIGQRKKLWA